MGKYAIFNKKKYEFIKNLIQFIWKSTWRIRTRDLILSNIDTKIQVKSIKILDRLKIWLTHKLYWREEVGSYWVLSWEPMERISMFWLERPPMMLFQCIIMWLSLSLRCCSWTCPRACMISWTIVFFCYFICIREKKLLV